MKEIPFQPHHSPSVDFPFGEVEASIEEPDQFAYALEVQRRVWSWIYQPPATDLDGFFCRACVCAWVFVPELRSYSETKMAGRMGKKKQSLGRWVVDFKKQFPDLTKHLKHLR